MWGNRHPDPGSMQIPKKMNPKRSTPRNIRIKLSKVKDNQRILKAAREKQLLHARETSIRLSADFSVETADQKEVEWYIQSIERIKTANQEYSTWKSYPSELKERSRVLQTSISWKSPSPLDWPYKKCQKHFFKLKWQLVIGKHLKA